MTPPSSPIGGWRKSSHSGSGTSGDCVEVAARRSPAMIALRDSKHPDGPVLSFTPTEWSAFISHIKRLS